METCKNCAFSEQDASGLVCLRSPPTPAMIPVRNPLTGQPEPSIISMRPQVQAGWYCGEWASHYNDDDKLETSVDQGGLQ